MKRLLSTLLTVVLLVSMLSAPTAMAATTSLTCSIVPSNTYVHNDNTNTGIYPDGTNMNPVTTTVTGFGGKASTDSSTSSLVPGHNTSVSDYNRVGNHKQYMGISDPSAVGNGYVVLEANIFPVNEQSIGNVALQPNAGIGISKAIKATDGIKAGQWNHIRFVSQPSTASTADSKYAKTWAYLNGVMVLNGEQLSGFSNEAYRYPRRLMFDSGSYKEYDQHLYWDDMKAYITDTMPEAPVMPVLTSTNKYGISGNKIVASGNLKISDITQSGMTIGAYDIRNPAKQLSADTVLDANHIIVAFSATSVSSYILGTNIDHTFINNSNGAGINNGDTAKEMAGVMGRADTDKSTYYTRSLSNHPTETNNNNHKYQYIISTGKDLSGYGDLIVFGLSFYAAANIGNICLTGDGGVNISKLYSVTDSRYFNEGWNKVVFAYDHATAGSAKGEKAGHWAMYINGKCVNSLGENLVDISAVKSDGTTYVGKGHMSQMRIMFSCANGNDLQLYCDDVFAYRIVGGKESTLASLSETTPEITAAAAGEYTVNNTLIAPTANATVASLKATEGADVAVYADDNYLYKMGANEKLEEDNKIIVSKNGIFSYYTVSSGNTNNKIYTANFSGGSYKSGYTLANDGFFTAEYVTGKAGKQSTDTSLNFKRAKADGQPESWNGNNIYTYLFAPTGKAYIKYEMNFMPGDENFKSAKFATQGHASTSIDLYCTDDGTSDSHVLNRYQWNKLVYVFKAKSTVADTSTYLIPGTYDLYVNGKKVVSNAAVDWRKTSNSPTGTTTPIRFAIYGKDTTVSSGIKDYTAISCFIDDVDVRWYDTEPTLRAMPYAIDDNGKTVLIEGNKYTIYDDLKVKDIKYSEGANLTVFDVPTYDYYLIDTNALYNNNLIVVWDKYNQFTYYTVTKELRNNAVITPYTGYYIAKANLKDAVLLLAGYDEYGNLKTARYSDKTGSTEVRIDGDYDIVKTFIWNNLNQLKPITEEKTYIAKPIVACWGASITYGQGATNWDTDTYPAQLATLTGFDVYNMGIGGETQTTIAARQGGLDMRVTEDITIPASGSVNFMFRAYDKDGTYAGVVSPRNASLAGWNPATINGVEGTLKVDIDNTIWPRTIKSATFTRKTAGEPVQVKKGDIMTVAANDINAVADITVICVSSNGGWNSENLTANDNQYSDLIKLVDKMIANTKDPSKYLVIGLTTQDGTAWKSTHSALANYYGDKFLNIKNYVASEQALIDAGITPTATDKEWIAAGHIPPSLINNPAPTMAGGTGYDNVHLNSAGYGAMAKAIYSRFIELGYCAAN